MSVDETENHLLLLDFREASLPDKCSLVSRLRIHLRAEKYGEEVFGVACIQFSEVNDYIFISHGKTMHMCG